MSAAPRMIDSGQETCGLVKRTVGLTVYNHIYSCFGQIRDDMRIAARIVTHRQARYGATGGGAVEAVLWRPSAGLLLTIAETVLGLVVPGAEVERGLWIDGGVRGGRGSRVRRFGVEWLSSTPAAARHIPVGPTGQRVDRERNGLLPWQRGARQRL